MERCKLKVETGRTYDIIIGNNIIQNIGEEVKKVSKSNQLLLVSDDIVYSFYGKKVKESLEKNGFIVYEYVFKNGELSKNTNTLVELLNFAALKHLCRSDTFIALGGGVVGDLTGFAASCYMRGVNYVQIPTTLLACVDSSVGGKTAVNLEQGKNMCGAFYQPSLVLCDTDTLKTLPKEIFNAGMAEVIKYAIIRDEKLFNILQNSQNIDDLDLADIIKTCVTIKAEVVKEDEQDNSVRQILNYGHTFGHAVEAQSAYKLSHGFCVAIGTAIISKAMYNLGLATKENYEKIIALLIKYELPTTSEYSKQQIFDKALLDKKIKNDEITIVISSKIGSCSLKTIKQKDLLNYIAL